MNRDDVKKLMKEWAFTYAVEVIQAAPERKGTLKKGIIGYATDRSFGVMIDVPHMKYTEEKWEYNRRWGKTLVNPNEKWLLSTLDFILDQAEAKGAKVYGR